MSDKDGRAKRRAKQRADARDTAARAAGLTTHIDHPGGRHPDATKGRPSSGYQHANIVVTFTAWHLSGPLPQPVNLELPAINGVVNLDHIEHGVASFMHASAYGLQLPRTFKVDVDERTGQGAIHDEHVLGTFAWSYAKPTTTAPTNLTA